MPRLLPRLLKALNKTPLPHVAPSQHVVSRKKISLYRPLPASLPSFNPAGRTRSILLDKNPITDKALFTRHKRLPPTGDVHPRTRVVGKPLPCVGLLRAVALISKHSDVPLLTTVRMLATPLRQCTISRRYLPNDFLIRLAVLRLPALQNSRSVEVLMPDGLEHPKYKRRKARVAVYVPCWKVAVETMKSPVSLPRYDANIFFSKHLRSHINYLLRLRVLQELQVLTDALKLNRHQSLDLDADADPTIFRRLTRSEFKTFRETGMLPFPDAVAVLVIPPVNRDPKTKLPPQPSHQPEIPSTEINTPQNSSHKKSHPPLSTLHYVSAPDGVLGQVADYPQEISLSTFLPSARVPQYNGVTMFPFPPHRAALHNALTKVLDIERRFRGTRPASKRREMNRRQAKRAKGDEKGSHAFLLMSSEQTVKRADTAPLAIALWRLRMWEGDAFAGTAKGWEVGKEWRIEHPDRPR